jgi:hypothetical protein
VSTYRVQDKKQVAEFDVQQWLGDNPEAEEEQGNPCPICNSAEREDVLLLCDSCDAAYHTDCIGLESVPEGDWYCMECAHLFELTQDPDVQGVAGPRPQPNRRLGSQPARGGFNVRTRARLRRARRQARNEEWQGVWGQFSGRFYEMTELDLDNHDDEDEDMERFRRFQLLDRRELQRWQQRIDIAHRLGASDAFANTIPPQISERLQPPPPAVPETRDERRAWGALDRAREGEGTSSATTNSRKRRLRSVTTSPVEPAQEPERKLKRPRTRRLPTQGEPSNAASSPAAVTTAPSATRVANGLPARNGHANGSSNDPPLVSSLLKELEPSMEANATSEDEISTTPGRRPFYEMSSPAISPSPSAHSSPRAMSLTPPPLPSAGGRPTSPTLSLSTHIQPRYPPANYSPNRYSSDHSDSDVRSPRTERRSPEIRQPRPRRVHQVPRRAEEAASAKPPMTQEEKKSINEIVKNALRPHWHAQKLTTEQYATINRDISRKLYDEVKHASSLDNESRRTWEKRATQEVAQAVAELQA